VTTTDSTITKDMTPAEAANLLAKLEEGNQAAWLSTREMSWQDPDYEARFQNAAEIDSVFRDIVQETVDNGMRRPGEPVEEFAERAESDAWLADPREVGAETATDLISHQVGVGMMPEHAQDSQGEIATHLTHPSTPEAKVYAKAFPDTAATYARGSWERDPLPEPDRTPGSPHPDPFLAGRGWRVDEHGIYSRKPDPQLWPRPEKDLEAG
jgi:hypothetical protein